jgi:hypothetical protein
MTNNNNSTLSVKLMIMDASGHTEETHPLQEALHRVIDEHFDNARWVTFQGSQFSFSAKSKTDTAAFMEDCARLRRLLESTDNPVVILQPDLRGGR